MRFLRQLLGFLLFVGGLYLISRNIFFSSRASYYGWRLIPAAGSVISFLSGLWILMSARMRDRYLGWILLGVGVVLVFLSSAIILRPTNLWTFLASFSLLIGGFKLMNPRRFEF